jgi:hypothetical protein
MQHSIRQQLKLNETQLKDAISCKVDRNGYVEILRAKGLISSAEPPTRAANVPAPAKADRRAPPPPPK